MRNWRSLCETIHLTALGVWLAGLVMAGGAAAVLFPTLRDLDPSLPAYSAYGGKHWQIAGGVIGQRLFFIADIIGLGAVIIAMLTLTILVRLGLARGRPSSYLRGVGLVVAFLAFAWNLFMVSPGMNSSLRAYRAAAQAGQHDEAAAFKTTFDDLHPRAGNLLALTAGGVFVAFVCGLWSVTTEPTDRGRPARSSLEEPKLLRKTGS